MQQTDSAEANIREERIRNYLRVVYESIGNDVEALTRHVNFIAMHELEWEAALNNVDNPAISPSQRAACFHRLIEQGTNDALHGDPGDWQVLSGEDHRARQAMSLTAPERIANIVARIRQEFPHLVSEFTR